MDRREFVIGMLTLAGGAACRPLFAHHGHYNVVESGSHLLLSVRIASRGSRAFAHGLPLEVTASAGLKPRFLSIESVVDRFGDRLSGSDRRQLERNLSFFADHFHEILDRDEARHFCSHWSHRTSHGPFEARAHLESCGACRQAWRVLIRSTRIDPVPLMIREEVTVVAGPQGADPKQRLHLPRLPDSMRPALAGKELRMRVCVDRHGVASVTRVESPDISDYVIRRAVRQIESTPWIAAAASSGRPVDDTVSVVFRWRS